MQGGGANLFARGRDVRLEREAAAGEAGEGHAYHAFYDSVVESVAGVFRFASAALDPAFAATGFVGGSKILLREWFAGAKQLKDSLAKLSAGGPGFIDRSEEHTSELQ